MPSVDGAFGLLNAHRGQVLFACPSYPHTVQTEPRSTDIQTPMYDCLAIYLHSKLQLSIVNYHEKSKTQEAQETSTAQAAAAAAAAAAAWWRHVHT